MKTTHAFWVVAVLGGSLFALQGCGVGEYKIPNVPPVVKEKPEEDILGGDSTDSKTEDAKPAAEGSSDDDSKDKDKK